MRTSRFPRVLIPLVLLVALAIVVAALLWPDDEPADVAAAPSTVSEVEQSGFPAAALLGEFELTDGCVTFNGEMVALLPFGTVWKVADKALTLPYKGRVIELGVKTEVGGGVVPYSATLGDAVGEKTRAALSLNPPMDGVLAFGVADVGWQ